MFTGLVQAVGSVVENAGPRLRVAVTAYDEPWQRGESVAINGCCLTVVGMGDVLDFDLSAETLARTNLGALAAGDAVNVERAMRMGDRLGGHLVQGHVDGTVVLESVSDLGGSWDLAVAGADPELLLDKGSVTLDGISLTVVSPSDEGAFRVAIIPETWAQTTLSRLAPGHRFNVEYDLLAKQVARIIRLRSGG